mmetsp:Transcript_31011/g.50166  ORF Transcript_31011/g.50166 Transcript_31011/m.50166 type:complete len:283 (+) Transcript_31011:154-1002(+)|eukprot:CAMPEP_0184665704 /NCGR_PEP_ID=MMETSP0308-20130426/58285_1 /TAXON_ID=38269 /ORGANISM="Gloeochaete witrockiana, Strain SAG 46.84" /LENGTH=282 /DNA_ID=CAMNT_0027109859 /DNA_START=81 /DNA_END=929 /DNA_ORIENTATION=-
MVLVHLKNSEENQFLCEIPVSTDVDLVIRLLVSIYNLRLKIGRLAGHAKDLCEHGVAKPPDQQGLDEVIEETANMAISEKGETYKADPTGRRTGIAPTKEMAGVIRRQLDEAQSCISKDQVSKRVLLSKEILEEAISRINGAVKIVYPGGLPEYDPVREELENKEQLEGSQASLEVMDGDTCTLWWAGKQLLRGQKMEVFVGKNEKTKIVAKLQKKGSGPPVRESPVDSDTQKAMLSYYYKKQEEQKKLVEDMEDSYLNSDWADPKSLKRHFQGVSNVSWRP